MTPSEITTVVPKTAQALPQIESGRAFVKSIRKILDALSCVPDYASPAFTREEIAQLQRTTEQVIAAIALRIDRGNDNETVQLELAQSVYELRREIEDVERWRRHFLGND